MSAIWGIFIIAVASLTIIEARKEKREFIKKNGMTRKQLFRAYKHMRGDGSKVTYQELLKNMNNN